MLELYPAPETLGRVTFPPVLTGADTDNVSMDGARDTVVHLGVQLGKNVSWTQEHSNVAFSVCGNYHWITKN